MVEQGVRFTMEVEGEVQLDRALSRFGDHLSDMSPFFEVVANMLQDIVGQQFDTEGGRTGGWTPLSPQYAAYKLSQVGSQPTLVYTGRMRRSLIERGGDNIREITSDSLRWGTSVRSEGGFPYPRAHQTGTRKMPQRRIIDLTEDDRRSLMKALQRFFVGDPGEFGLEKPAWVVEQ
jgi:phage gpG-like protein